MEVIEKEARVLRERNAQLESENEKLQQETKQKYGRKPPASTHEKLQMDKFALEEKVRTMEGKVKEANKRAEEAERQAGLAKQGQNSKEKVTRKNIWLRYMKEKNLSYVHFVDILMLVKIF